MSSDDSDDELLYKPKIGKRKLVADDEDSSDDDAIIPKPSVKRKLEQTVKQEKDANAPKKTKQNPEDLKTPTIKKEKVKKEKSSAKVKKEKKIKVEAKAEKRKVKVKTEVIGKVKKE